MTLRKKTLLIIGLTLIGFTLILYVFSQIISTRSFAQLEEQSTRRDVERAMDALNSDLSNLNANAVDWAAWDDTWTFMTNADEGYIKSNLVESTFTDLDLNLLLLINPSGRIIFGKSYNLDDKMEVPVPDSLREHLSPGAILLRHPNPESSVTGIVLLPEGPLLVASHAILTSEHNGPERGTLIMGRYLNSARTKRLAGIAHLSLVLHRLDDPRLPEDFQASLPVLREEKPVSIRPLNQEYVAGYALLKDIYGKPGLLMRVDLRRDIYRQGMASQRYFIYLFLVAGLIFGAGILLLLEKTVLTRLAGLNESVKKIRKSSNFSTRLTVAGRDELACFAEGINEMLAALEQSQCELKDSEEKYRQLFDNSITGIYISTPDGKILLCNPALARILAFSSVEEAMRANTFSFYPDRLDRERFLQVVSKTKKLVSHELELIRRDGQRITTVHNVHGKFAANGELVQIRGYLFDITELKQAEETSRRRLGFEKTVARISSRFTGAVEINEAMNSSLADLGLLSGADRAAIFLFDPDRETVSNILEWCIHGVLPQKNNFQKLSTARFPWWFAKLCRGEVILIEDVSRMTAEKAAEKEVLEARDSKSILALPLHAGGELIGFIGLDNIRETGKWREDDLALLMTMAEIIGNSLERKQAEESLRENEERYRMLFENALNPIFVVEEDGRYLDANEACLKFLECSRDMLLSSHVWDSFHPSILGGLKNSLFTDRRTIETRYLVKGENKTLLLNIIPARVSGKMVLYGIGQDITERKEAEEQMKYLSLHDPLTGLYNRAYFEQEMRRLEKGRRVVPAGIVMCDVDGLKLINDSLGHSAGDQLLKIAAEVLKKSFRDVDMVARVGGDEFAILLSSFKRTAVESACRRIREAIAGYNTASPAFPLSMSIGCAYRSDISGSMDDLYKEADNNMYREKLHHRQSVRNAIVQTLKKLLEARDFFTEGHADRLRDLVEGLAAVIGLPAPKVPDLLLFAQFHDLGKVGIADRILFKRGPLTPEENAEMKRHCEIGHRIAQSTPDLLPIADWILKHHEWWNGRGYPLGLKGEEIPLECRILAIADAYDAMTNDRPYRRAVTHREAIAELKRCSGTQFDPLLVEKFIEAFEKGAKLNSFSLR